jgi:hypothetical protein
VALNPLANQSGLRLGHNAVSQYSFGQSEQLGQIPLGAPGAVEVQIERKR